MKRLARLCAVLLSALLAASLLGATPTSAQEAAPPDAPTVRCDIDAFDNVKLVDAGFTVAARFGRGPSATKAIALDQPIPAGRVLVHGVSADPLHIGDEPDFTTDRSQFGEQFRVRFLGADGAVVGESDPTPDIPDTTYAAPFALPSVDLSAPAVRIQLVHAGDGSSWNSVVGACINVDTVAPDAPPSQRVVASLCPDDSPDTLPGMLCGFLAVPEERSDPDSRLIQIAFGIAYGDGTHADPVVYLEGGPGGAPLAASLFIQELAMGPAVGGRDVIYVDQRGTGYSYPNLACMQPQDFAGGPGEEGPPAESEEEAIALVLAAIDACEQRLVAEGADLSAYTSIENGLDIAELREALGIAEWNLFGGSYGTTLALNVMRDRPEGVRSVVLDSVFPPEVNPYVDDRIGYLKGLDATVERCAGDADCNAAFPDLRNDIIAAFDNLAAEPIFLDTFASEILLGPGVPVEPALLAFILDIEQADPFMPALANGLASPDPDVRRNAATQFTNHIAREMVGLPAPEMNVALLDYHFGVPGAAQLFSDGFFFSVICAADFPNQDLFATEYDGDWGPLIESLNPFGDIFECEVWDVEPEDIKVQLPVVSDLPSLVLLSDTDIQTRPEWSVLTAARLPNSQLFEFPQLNHVVTFTNECPQSIVSQFFDDPSGSIDASCIADLPIIDFVGALPTAPDITPEELDALFGPPPGEDGPPPGEDGPPPGDEGAPVVSPVVALVEAALTDS